ncbi:MAG: SUMF1/EgtB/PvdO family nonheme iron enzyme [Vicinamibacterales bacterium]
MSEELLPSFAAIPSGDFVMGADEGADDERPSRAVHVDAYHVSMHAITVDQYAVFARETEHPPPALRALPLVVTASHELQFRELAAPYVWRSGEPPRDRGRHPVTLVTHADALAYCRWLSVRIGQLVRLPTEAEWGGRRAAASSGAAIRGATTSTGRAATSCPIRP